MKWFSLLDWHHVGDRQHSYNTGRATHLLLAIYTSIIRESDNYGCSDTLQ